MPTYVFECQKCGHRFEEFQRHYGRAVKSCRKAIYVPRRRARSAQAIDQ